MQNLILTLYMILLNSNNMSFESMTSSIEASLQSGESLSGFLLLDENLEMLHLQLSDYITGLCSQYAIAPASVLRLDDLGENIKIDVLRNYLHSAWMRPSYQFQICVIENISRLTQASANSMLKFLEEPPAGTLIFLTNRSQAWVLDTITSRVVSMSMGISQWYAPAQHEFFQHLVLQRNIQIGKKNLLQYIYSGSFEKSEYQSYIETILHTPDVLSPQQMEEIQDDIESLRNNNVLPKYLLDKWVMTIL